LAPSAPATARLSDIQVESNASGTQVTLLGLRDPSFDSFQDQDPARVVVDLANVEPGDVASDMAVYDGLVDEVTIAKTQDDDGTPKTRVEIRLDSDASHAVVTGPDRLTIQLKRKEPADTLATADSPDAATMDDPWAAPGMDVADGSADGPQSGAGTGANAAEGNGGSHAVAVAETPMAPPVAVHLTAVSASADAGGVTVKLAADGRIEGAKEFTLTDPLRFVVDLPGMTSEVATPRMNLGLPLVKAVRVGQHLKSVRIVLDAAEGVTDFGGTQVVPVETGLLVGLGPVTLPAPSVAVAPPAPRKEAPVALPEALNATETSQRVSGVALEKHDGMDRVVIVTEKPADYTTLQPDLETLVVEVRGATLDLPADKARITPDKPGAVSLVSAFEQPDAKVPEVRVLIRQAKGSIPTVTQKGGMLVLDFPHASELAENVPMLQEEPTTAPEDAEPTASEAAMRAAKVAESEDSVASTVPVKVAAPAAAAKAQPVPAAVDPAGNATDILQEGGLVDGKTYTGRRISLDFKDVDIDDVLRLIAEVSDLNIIAGDEVSGQVTIRLVDVPWDQALDVILLTKGLGFVRVGNVLRIAPSDVLKSEEEARLQERRAKEKLEDLVVKLQPVNYANVKDVKKMVKRLLTSRGTVDIDQRTNTVILKDIPSVIDEATALIKAIDTQTPQVMIEAKIVEASLDFLREIGATWSAGVQPRTNAFDSTSSLRDHVGGQNFKLRPASGVGAPVVGSSAANSIAVANPITSLANGAVNIGAFLLNDRFNVDVQLDAAESHGDGKVISSPRVVTLDNRKASIEQGVSIPFQTFENGDAKLEFIDAVLRLEVTPHITADKSIIMKIQVERNAPDDSVPTPTGSPAIAKNEAETETLVRDGQTLVIGGIYVVNQSNRETRVPYLHKIPILGNAFKSKLVKDERKELLVFVTPRIVVNPETGS